MLFALPTFGWIFAWAVGLILHMAMALPFWIAWNLAAPRFFAFLPAAYHTVGFWEVVGLFVVITILKAVLLPWFPPMPRAKSD